MGRLQGPVGSLTQLPWLKRLACHFRSAYGGTSTSVAIRRNRACCSGPFPLLRNAPSSMGESRTPEGPFGWWMTNARPFCGSRPSRRSGCERALASRSYLLAPFQTFYASARCDYIILPFCLGQSPSTADHQVCLQPIACAMASLAASLTSSAESELIPIHSSNSS